MDPGGGASAASFPAEGPSLLLNPRKPYGEFAGFRGYGCRPGIALGGEKVGNRPQAGLHNLQFRRQRGANQATGLDAYDGG